MSKVLIIFAQSSEAKQTLERLNACSVKTHSLHIWSEGVQECFYEFDQGFIALSNVGIHNAQGTVTKYGHLADEIWNLGIAGCLSPCHKIGALLSIEKVGKYIPLKHELDLRSLQCVDHTLPIFSLSGTHSLISSDFPIHGGIHREQLCHEWDLVDMEGYGVAYAAHQLGKKCRLWKIVSDFASPEGRALIREHKEQLTLQLADHIERELCRKK